jgi:hypothetical protein
LVALDACAFEGALREWIQAQGVTVLDRRVLALDGKAL